MKGKKCTLKDIADELNITVNSVSKALRESVSISAKTKQAVKECALRKGYIPNIAASSLRSGKSKTIAILYDYLLNPYYSIVTSHVDKNLSKYGYTVMIFTDSNDESKLCASIAKKMIAHNVDGVISFLQPDEEAMKIFDFYKISLIVLGRDSTSLGLDSIVADDEEGGYKATRHLIEKGHKRIIAMSLPLSISCSQDRLKGYKRALTENGIAIDENLIKVFGVDGTHGGEIVDKARKSGLDFSAVFCFNDMMAFEVVTYLQEKNIKIPENCAIVGFDNLQKDICFPTRLTTIDSDKKQMVDVAIEVLLYKIESTDKAERSFNKIHKTELIQGITT